MNTYHFHHIIPRHMGGTDDPSNLIKLTVEEHAEVHRKLWIENGLISDYLAWQGLSGLKTKSEIVSEMISNTHKGKKVSQETRKKIRNTLLGRKLPPRSEEWKRNLSNSLRGKNKYVRTEEHRKKTSTTLKGISNRGAFKKGNIPWNKGKRLKNTVQ